MTKAKKKEPDVVEGVVDQPAAPAETSISIVDQAQEIAKTKPMPGYLDVGQLIQVALDKNIGVDALEKLVMLNERVADRQARQEFNASLARFQNRCPEIPESAKADIDTKSGAKYSYRYTKLKDLIRYCRPVLYNEGFSFTWDTGVSDRGHAFAIFILSHVAGHETRSRFECPVEGRTRMSDAQKHSSADTTAKRRSMIAGLGIQTVDDIDDDGADPVDDHRVTEKQAKDLNDILQEVDADIPRFLAFFGVSSIQDLPARRFPHAMQMLEAKRRAR